MDTDALYRNLGNRIRDLRKKTRRTQDQIARRVGISRASLANIEAGRQQVLVHHLVALAKALDLDSPSDLLLVLQELTRQPAARDSLPLPDEGLTAKQRREIVDVLTGMSGKTRAKNRETE